MLASAEASNRASKFTIDEDLEWHKVWSNGCSAAGALALLWAFLITFEPNIKMNTIFIYFMLINQVFSKEDSFLFYCTKVILFDLLGCSLMR